MKAFVYLRNKSLLATPDDIFCCFAVSLVIALEHLLLKVIKSAMVKKPFCHKISLKSIWFYSYRNKAKR